ncbi:MAG: hypothetical protein KKG89_06260, partial [Alphaproteobacteria bacterium]|nr:hypothetical protein [Alphaproteobacteria bacterium]
LAGGIAVAAVGVAGGAVLALRGRRGPQPPPADVAPLIEQASLAIQQSDSAGDTTAIGLMQRVTAAHPDYAPGWGLLAEIYAHASHWAPTAVAPTMVARAKETAQRALALDPHNAAAPLALAMTLPLSGSWGATETASRAVLAHEPDDYLAIRTLAHTMGQVGRCRERGELMDHAAEIGAPTPSLLYNHAVALWAAGRLEDADRAMVRAMEISPRHYAVWFTRLYLLLYTGRAAQALGMVEDVDGRPNGIPESEFENLRVIIPAIRSQTPAAVAAATTLSLSLSHHGAGHAENGMQWTSAMGQLDAAFAIAEAYYFDRGFSVGDVRFSTEQGRYMRKADRSSYILFLPSTAAMRADPRFKALVEEIGLEVYWRRSGSRPDFRV